MDFALFCLFCYLETNQCFVLKLYSIIYIHHNVQNTKNCRILNMFALRKGGDISFGVENKFLFHLLGDDHSMTDKHFTCFFFTCLYDVYKKMFVNSLENLYV